VQTLSAHNYTAWGAKPKHRFGAHTLHTRELHSAHTGALDAAAVGVNTGLPEGPVLVPMDPVEGDEDGEAVRETLAEALAPTAVEGAGVPVEVVDTDGEALGIWCNPAQRSTTTAVDSGPVCNTLQACALCHMCHKSHAACATSH
jgi:hypothetical protein